MGEQANHFRTYAAFADAAGAACWIAAAAIAATGGFLAYDIASADDPIVFADQLAMALAVGGASLAVLWAAVGLACFVAAGVLRREAAS